MAREMRYSRGQPLTVQERAGGGQGAGRNWLGNFGAEGESGEKVPVRRTPAAGISGRFCNS